jgi:hypothetical protein
MASYHMRMLSASNDSQPKGFILLRYAQSAQLISIMVDEV